MKVTFSLMILLVGLTSSSFAYSPIEGISLISNSSLEMFIADTDNSMFLESAKFLKQENEISFKTKYEISYIQIFDSKGVLEYQLPIMSKKVNISKSLFDVGKYKLVFVFKDGNESLNSELLIK